MNIAAMGILTQVFRVHFHLSWVSTQGFLDSSVGGVNSPGCGWVYIFIHVCSEYKIKRPLVATVAHAFKSGRVPEVNISLRPRKKPVMYKVFKWEPFRTALAFRVTQVFNFDLCKSLPLLAAGKGQRGHFEVKKKKNNSWGRSGNPSRSCPCGFGPEVSRQ